MRKFKDVGVLYLDDGLECWSMGEKGIIRRFWPHITAFVALLCLIYVSFLFWLELSRRFPLIEAGSYMGKIIGDFPGYAQGKAIPFYVERAPGGNELLFVVLHPAWRPQTVPMVLSSDNGSPEQETKMQWLHPVVISSNNTSFQFIGSIEGPRQYVGTLRETTSGISGRWWLKPVQESSGAMEAKDREEVRLWASLRSEYDRINEQIEMAEAKAPTQHAEIERLADVLTEGHKFKSKANQRFEAAQSEMKQAETLLAQRREVLKKLSASFDVSQRITGAGRLVSLARNSLEREWAWVGSMLKTQANTDADALFAAYEHGLKILELKAQIAQEKAMVEQELLRGH